MLRTGRERIGVAFGRLSTSAKMIVILSTALMPLGIIALIASLQANRSADAERRSQLRVASVEAARKLSTEVGSDVGVLREAARLAGTGARDDACRRVQSLLDVRRGRGISYVVFGAEPNDLCSNVPRPPERPQATGVAGDPTATTTPTSRGER